MKKVIVIGCPGAGKSHFSRALHERVALPLYHLDLLYWNPDRTTVGREIFRERLEELLVRDEWIIDGNYASTLELRLAACDTVFVLDYPLEVCLRGARERRGRPRPDMPWIETEEDGELIRFIRRYREENRPQVLALLEKYSDREIHVLESRADADRFLDEYR